MRRDAKAVGGLLRLMLLLVRANTGFQQFDRLFGTAQRRHLELLATLSVVRDEEFFNLREEGLAYLIDGGNVLVLIGMDRDAEKAIVAFRLSPFALLGGDDADDTNVHLASYMRRRIHQDEHIQRIAVLAQRGRYEAKIERKQHPFRQQATEL